MTAATCAQCNFTTRPETGRDAVIAHLDSQHYHASRFPDPEPYALLIELCIRPGQTAHQLATALGHRVTCRGRRLTYDAAVRRVLARMASMGIVRCEEAPGGRGRAGFHRLWYAAVRP